ncbi:hypothetical protein NQ314_011101 [Rhamnusium bicolor]|uniref:Uncharacterized protein n=1 Tax=Rhamnusium bicolor TaxID=1586634 RepID=A0AAV8XLU0_9CUCU|nr:hypothetical protein NQ314_011101 [Rhamnusium bicolor]
MNYNLFTVLKITSLEERTLNGALVLKDKTQFIWPQIDEDDSSILSRANRSARDSTDLEITLAPMQIRTFIATVQTTNK